MSDYLTAADVAAKLNKSIGWARLRLAEGAITSFRFGGAYHTTQEAVDAYVAANVHQPAPKKSRRRPRRAI